MKLNKSFLTVVGLVVALALTGVAWLFARGPKDEVFSAHGSSWYLSDAEWQEYEGKWRIAGVVHPKRVTRKINGSIRDITHAMCGGILTSMPGAPEAVSRQDVFRVSLHMANQDGDLFTENAVPTPVLDGACSLTEDDVIYPSYPGILGFWSFRGVETRINDETEVPEGVIFVFQPMILAGEKIAGPDRLTDFALACRVVVADIRNGDISQAELAAKLIEKAKGRVAIKVLEPRAIAGVLGRYEISDWMSVTDAGECTNVTQTGGDV